MPRLSSLWRHQPSSPTAPMASSSRPESRSVTGATSSPVPAPVAGASVHDGNAVHKPLDGGSVHRPLDGGSVHRPRDGDPGHGRDAGKPARKRCLNEGAHKLAD